MLFNLTQVPGGGIVEAVGVQNPFSLSLKTHWCSSALAISNSRTAVLSARFWKKLLGRKRKQTKCKTCFPRQRSAWRLVGGDLGVARLFKSDRCLGELPRKGKLGWTRGKDYLILTT